MQIDWIRWLDYNLQYKMDIRMHIHMCSLQ